MSSREVRDEIERRVRDLLRDLGVDIDMKSDR